MDGGTNLPVPVDHGAPISRLVAEVVARCPGERVSLGELAELFGDRAFGLLILLLCLPALLPGVAVVFGVPILILGIQMGCGLRRPKLPGFLARRSLKRADILRLTEASSRWLSKVERLVKPRPGPFLSPAGDRAVGWLAALSALMLILPGPGTNGPPAFGTIVMALGVLEADNRTVAIGIAATALGCLFAIGMMVTLGWIGLAAFNWMF
jgi:hypothetical protein